MDDPGPLNARNCAIVVANKSIAHCIFQADLSFSFVSLIKVFIVFMLKIVGNCHMVTYSLFKRVMEFWLTKGVDGLRVGGVDFLVETPDVTRDEPRVKGHAPQVGHSK